MPRRVLEGKVVSDKMDKTVTVLVERNFMHPKYKKYIRRSAKYAAHDENNTVKEGETIKIIECAPISKRKSWTVVKEGSAAPTKEEKKAAKKAAPKKVAPKKEAAPKADAKETKAVKKAPAKKAVAKKTTKKETKK